MHPGRGVELEREAVAVPAGSLGLWVLVRRWAWAEDLGPGLPTAPPTLPLPPRSLSMLQREAEVVPHQMDTGLDAPRPWRLAHWPGVPACLHGCVRGLGAAAGGPPPSCSPPDRSAYRPEPASSFPVSDTGTRM